MADVHSILACGVRRQQSLGIKYLPGFILKKKTCKSPRVYTLKNMKISIIKNMEISHGLYFKTRKSPRVYT